MGLAFVTGGNAMRNKKNRGRREMFLEGAKWYYLEEVVAKIHRINRGIQSRKKSWTCIRMLEISKVSQRQVQYGDYYPKH